MIIYKFAGTETVIPRGVSFTNNDITYPPNWLELATSEDLADHGIEAVEVPDPEPAPVDPVPLEVTPRQLRLALLDLALLDQVNSFLALADEATKIEWEYATVIRRDHQMWIVGAQFLNKTSEDIDNLFILAGSK